MRLLLPLLIALLGIGLIAGCGGGDEADSGTDVNQLLDETFSGGKDINSGRIDLGLRVESQGGEQSGPVTIDISGPFQSEGEGRLPRFQISASLQGAGENLEAGVTSTGDAGYVNLQGTDYQVSRMVFQQFKAGFEQTQQQDQQEGQSLASLGIDPRRWLTNARNAGESEVGGTETIKITGGVDVGRLLDDVNTALERTRSLGLQGAEELPERLTEEQKRQATEAVRNLAVEIHTGKEDKILRRMLIRLDLQAPEGTDTLGVSSARIALDLSLLELNEDQEITAPESPRPFEELVGSLGGLGLGGAGGGAGGGGGGGASQENLQKYSQCIQAAGNDTQKARECSELLTP